MMEFKFVLPDFIEVKQPVLDRAQELIEMTKPEFLGMKKLEKETLGLGRKENIKIERQKVVGRSFRHHAIFPHVDPMEDIDDTLTIFTTSAQTRVWACKLIIKDIEGLHFHKFEQQRNQSRTMLALFRVIYNKFDQSDWLERGATGTDEELLPYLEVHDLSTTQTPAGHMLRGVNIYTLHNATERTADDPETRLIDVAYGDYAQAA